MNKEHEQTADSAAAQDTEGQQTERRTLFDIMMNANLFGQKRRCIHDMDYGDDRTIGKHLIRHSAKEGKRLDETAHDYGIYLGEVDGMFYVATMSVLETVPSDYIAYDSVEHMKRHWRLD